MKKLGWFLCCSVIAASISFISLMIAALNLEKLPAILIWIIATTLGVMYSIKLWKKKVTTPINLKPGENRWQGWEKVKHENDSYDDSISESHYNAFDNRHWYERDDILWQGKRKAYIVYKDRHGEVTERNITMHGIMPNQNGELTLRAMCHLREDWRTFYADRIIQIKTARNKTYDDFSEYMATELNI
ncbi:WYL domain-containing protein [Vibrio sp. 1075]|uniref:WYL domain-containing protein n=1 Tax=Vibrio sp. 1075 TaxID=3074543 RepID=UPI0029649014|nr:WYL domain-containing protein [Vibrio sp. 1075]MDW2310599.1 WYL domain-containing protein [Vibrio sp. 1075]